MEQLRVRPHRGSGHLRHEVAENELPEPVAQTIAVVNEIAFAAMGNALGLHAFRVHDRIVIAEIIGAFLAQHFEHGGRNDGGQNHVALLLVKVALRLGDIDHGETLPKKVDRIFSFCR